MKKKGLYMVLCALLMVLLLAPMVQQQAHPFKLKKLNGAIVKVEKPELTLEAYRDVSYQSKLESYIGANFGFHEWVIRLYNQYLWLFRKTYAADVVVGKDKWLYGVTSVKNHYRQASYEFADTNEEMEQMLGKDVERLKKVQDLLEQRGIKCFFLVCPSKDILYPEYLPEYGEWVMGDGLVALDYCLKAFDEQGVNYLDLCTWFAQIKDSVDYPIFPRTGLHWSDAASVYAADTLIRYMEQLTGKNLPNLQIGPLFESETWYPDNDLERSMNLMWPIQPNTNLYTSASVIPDSTAQPLSLLTIGDSFYWNFGFTLPMDKLFKTHHHWYYFSSVHFDPEHTSVDQINLLDEFSHTDVVMLCYNASKLYGFNHGFLSRAQVELSLDDPESLNRIIDVIKQRMENNKEWYESIKLKAVQRGKTLDEVMREDALYLISKNPEDYLNN